VGRARGRRVRAAQSLDGPRAVSLHKDHLAQTGARCLHRRRPAWGRLVGAQREHRLRRRASSYAARALMRLVATGIELVHRRPVAARGRDRARLRGRLARALTCPSSTAPEVRPRPPPRPEMATRAAGRQRLTRRPTTARPLRRLDAVDDVRDSVLTRTEVVATRRGLGPSTPSALATMARHRISLVRRCLGRCTDRSNPRLVVGSRFAPASFRSPGRPPLLQPPRRSPSATMRPVPRLRSPRGHDRPDRHRGDPVEPPVPSRPDLGVI